MSGSIVRIRVIAIGILVLVFGAGIALGFAIAGRSGPGMRIMVTTTDAIPAELGRLDLTTAQRDSIVAILRRGRPRILDVLRTFEPKMQAAVDSTEAEIAAVLDPDQRTRWSAGRTRRLQLDTTIVRKR